MTVIVSALVYSRVAEWQLRNRNDFIIITHFQTTGMKSQWNDGTSQAHKMEIIWKPKIPEWSWNGIGMSRSPGVLKVDFKLD